MRFDDRHEVVVTGPWTEEMVQAVESGVADRVVLNYALGYDEPDLYFLQYLPIRELVILDRRITDLAPVHTLRWTRAGASCRTSCPGSATARTRRRSGSARSRRRSRSVSRTPEREPPLR